VERLLLAAQLSEDRNQAVEWLRKAEKLVPRDKPSIELLLAKAEHARTSPNWRDAFPYVDRVLTIDPDNVPAVGARVQLYNAAGLRRTALAALERAVERNPHSVQLLNMHASQLRLLGRSTEAAEVEHRYFALRFDDRSFLNQMLELALARRDRPAAERWVARLLDLEPDSQWALTRSARAYQQLGQSERAVATLERALELAPEDVSTLSALADLHGQLGRRDQQLALLRDVLKIRPQDRAVREYVEHIEMPAARPDEAYAWAPERFLPFRDRPARGHNRRTLRELSVTTVFENGLSSRFRQVVFQPLTDAAAAMARQYSFMYEADQQMVQLRGARVYRADGKVDEAIESGEGAADDPSISMYTSARTFYVQFPRLNPGDIVELRYRIDDVTPRNEFASYFGELMYMQQTEPVADAEYVLITPKSRNIYVDEHLPRLKRTVKEKGDQRIYHFHATDVPALKPEPSMPPLGELLGFVHVSTYKNWQDLGRWYWGLAKDQFDLDDETRKLARNIAKDAKTDLDKVKAVYGWVIKNTRYVALEFGIEGYKPRRCVQTVARGWGDCKDKATVIVTLLKELGIDSTIVILRTQMRGAFPSKLPSLAPFDHAIAFVPSLNLYLDGTAEFTGSGELPEMDLEALGLHVNQGKAELVQLPPAKPGQTLVKRELRAAVEAGGSAQLELSYETQGTHAAQWRQRYHAEATLRDRINQDIGREFPGFEIAPGARGVQTNDLEDVEQPVQIKVVGRAPGYARSEGKQLTVAVTPAIELTRSYASLSQRRLDVRLLAPPAVDETVVIKLPPGARVVRAPPDVSQQTPFGSYSVAVERQPGQVSVKSRLSVTATRVKPKQYKEWRRFCAQVDNAFSQRLVIQK
jgi:tetratricopeptide (TPR) repeat protein